MKKITSSEFLDLSYKYRCLLMWEWLAETGNNSKTSFYDECIIDWEKTKNSCWACEEDEKYDGECNCCPITWGNSGMLNDCNSEGSPYHEWCLALGGRHKRGKRKKYALEIVKLIKETWNE